MPRNTLLVTTVILLPILGMSQNKESYSISQVSNRIGITESSRAIVKGSFLLEGGLNLDIFNVSRNNNLPYTNYIIRLPDLSISYGITKRIEIRFATNYTNFSTYINDSVNHRIESKYAGFGGKINLTKQKGLIPETAFLINQSFIHSNYRNNISWMTEANFLWSYKLGSKLKLSGSVIYNYNNEYFKNQLSTSILLSYKLNDNIGVFGEYDYSGYYNSTAGLGFWWQVSPRVLISLQGNIGLPINNILIYKPSYYSLSLGVSFSLNNPNKLRKNNKRRKY